MLLSCFHLIEITPIWLKTFRIPNENRSCFQPFEVFFGFFFGFESPAYFCITFKVVFIMSLSPVVIRYVFRVSPATPEKISLKINRPKAHFKFIWNFERLNFFEPIVKILYQFNINFIHSTNIFSYKNFIIVLLSFFKNRSSFNCREIFKQFIYFHHLLRFYFIFNIINYIYKLTYLLL